MLIRERASSSAPSRPAPHPASVARASPSTTSALVNSRPSQSRSKTRRSVQRCGLPRALASDITALSQVLETAKRLNWMHINGLELFPLFAASVVRPCIPFSPPIRAPPDAPPPWSFRSSATSRACPPRLSTSSRDLSSPPAWFTTPCTCSPRLPLRPSAGEPSSFRPRRRVRQLTTVWTQDGRLLRWHAPLVGRPLHRGQQGLCARSVRAGRLVSGDILLSRSNAEWMNSLCSGTHAQGGRSPTLPKDFRDAITVEPILFFALASRAPPPPRPRTPVPSLIDASLYTSAQTKAALAV